MAGCRECREIKTVQKYLDAGAYFYRHGFEIDRTTNLPVIEPITDPQQIVRLETSARCWWETSKNRDKPSPHNPR
jgi:hypothetical protein